MKSTFYKIIALILACLMLIPFSGCVNDSGKDDPEGTGDISDTSAAEEQPPIEKKDYGGEEFNVLYCHDVFDPDRYFPEKEEGVRVSDEAYARSLEIKDHLNVQIVSTDGGSFTEYYPKLQTTLKSEDDMYKLVMTHCYMGIESLISKNEALDFGEIPGLNLDAPYWNNALMSELSVNDKMYLGYNDFCLANCYLIAFNKKMYENKKLEDPYALVDNYEWTLDKFIQLASVVSTDTDGDGKMTEKDTYGFVGYCWVPEISFLTASNIKILDKNEDGEIYVSLDVDYQEKVITLIEKMQAFYKSDSTFFWGVNAGDKTISIVDDRTLFAMPNVYDLIKYTDSDVKIGVLPYPMYDSAQKAYKTLNWSGYLAIPRTVQNLEMEGDTLEMLAYCSKPVKTAFYEVLLGARIADAPEDARMLDIVWASQVSDLGLVFDSSSSALDGLLYMLPTLAANGNSYTSFYKGKEKAVNKGIEKLFKQKG